MLSKFSIPAKISAVFILTVCIIAIFAPLTAPYSFQEQDVHNALSSPTAKHLMGTDRLGRDLFSRMVYGARLSLFIGVFTTLTALFIGTIYGGLSGYIGGKTDNILMRVVDVVFALPELLLIILIMVVLGRGPASIFLALTMVSWVTAARLVRGEVLRIKQFTFVEAASALGASHTRILCKEILPNILGALTITLTFRIPVAILAESTLSFIGLGIAPPSSSWGVLANDGWTAIKFHPHLILFPSLAIFMTILSFNFLGEGIQNYFDPKGQFHKSQKQG